MRFFYILSTLSFFILNFPTLRASYLAGPASADYVTYNASLTIPNPLPEDTFVIYTINDRNSVTYSEDGGFPGSAKGQCKGLAGPDRQFLGPCLITVDYESLEGFMLARCRPQDGSDASTDASVQIHLWYDDTVGVMKADMYVHSSHAWYGFGNEPKDSPLHSNNQTFINPDQVILINCADDKRTPISDY
ncbi:uncharacterized protein FA14DRAFT_182665 [Meira miltonrushii]|uniref:Uncharacterized protein n=1 Tax=Meira miltonrushii TaxID=1280837 RepID=A0A316V2F6_9BASI|nr:uncharacterized protein FA14DRAFT_182665 [Meira miltonrushii]PWN31444.1 hypothetical protein FA14DRAFT_182665 [Meira miltonrushii]